jgi:hypothetical protein
MSRGSCTAVAGEVRAADCAVEARSISRVWIRGVFEKEAEAQTR